MADLNEGNGVISGWINGSSTPLLLKKLEIPLITNEECFQFLGKYRMRSGRLCAGFLQEDGSALDGDFGFDEGSPIACEDDNHQKYLCGVFSVVSPAVKLGEEVIGGYPIVFSEISSFILWIRDTLMSP
jgi:hypothetical protein